MTEEACNGINLKNDERENNRSKQIIYTGEYLARIAFPLGGIGAGMVSLEGTGALSQVSLRHKPDINNEPQIFAALYVADTITARVLEGPVPMWKAFGSATGEPGNGLKGRTYGLPRFADVSFQARFPFATITLTDPGMPVRVEVVGWSPFTPGAADDSSLPVAALEYRFTNKTTAPIDAVFSFHAANFMTVNEEATIKSMEGGFILDQPAILDHPEAEGGFAAFTDDPEVTTDIAWFRGGWFDSLTMVWNHVVAGHSISRDSHPDGAHGIGGSLYVPFKLEPGEEKNICLQFAWFVPHSILRVNPSASTNPATGCDHDCSCSGGKSTPEFHIPWYAAQFAGLNDVAAYWRKNYDRLRISSLTFSDCFYDTTLPSEAIEAVAANLSILKSPTCLRTVDGRLWGWEGCSSACGCCHGSCSHVWNYAQSIAHLFPGLERTLRETEFMVNQDECGHQNFRTVLPIQTAVHDYHAAADGQLGGLMKLYREWRISGDTAWMKRLWPAARCSLDYCIVTWDPDHIGTLIEPHHTTYDIEFWGSDSMCTTFYLGALTAAIAMGRALDVDVAGYEELLVSGCNAMKTTLWNGNWFIQNIQWKGLRAGNPVEMKHVYSSETGYSPEAVAILEREGPKYQYGDGCLSDGVLGDWIARCCGLGTILDNQMIPQHLVSVFKYNFRESLTDHANPQRPGYAFGQEGGLLLCSWPRGGKPSLPFIYSDEVWTGIEYQVACHLIMTGHVNEGLAIVRVLRSRYDGRWRNPFDEYECGHWYARAMASYGLLQALGGARYDAVDKVLYVDPAIQGDFRNFLCTATGFGTVGLRGGIPFIEVISGSIPAARIVVKGNDMTATSSQRESL